MIKILSFICSSSVLLIRSSATKTWTSIADSSVVEGITEPIDTIPTPLDDIIPIEEEEITVAVIEKDPSFQAFIKENNIRNNEFKAVLKADSVKVKKEYNNWKEGKKVNTRSLKTKRYVTQPRGDQE